MLSDDCLEPICKRLAETEVTLQSRNRLLISFAAAKTYSDRMVSSYLFLVHIISQIKVRESLSADLAALVFLM